MTTINRLKNKSTLAPDILGKSQNWIQKVSSLRLSNIRVGYQLTSLIGDKEMKINDLFIPSFVKIVSYLNNYYILLGGISGLRICRIIEASNNSDISIELIYEDTNISCIDCCVYDPTNSQLTFAILYSGQQSNNTYTHFIQTIFLDNGPQTRVKHEFEGVPEKISSTNSFLLVAVSPGYLRVFYGENIRPITEIPSVLYTPIVFAVAPRWIAVQVPQKDIGSTTATNAIISHNSPQVVDENSKDALVSSGDTARRVVSGLYTLSKMSWQMVQPFLSHSNSKSSSKHSPSTTSRPQPEVGGGILVLDLESYQSSQPEDQNDLKERKSLDHTHILETLPIITHFVSHQGESLSIMAFSPTGLKLASVDTHGQVIFVHALVPSGLTSHSHQVVGLLNPNRPYLLYKLVRGLTLAKIVDIGFDLSESIAFASSINGTVHIFDLNSTTTESNEIKSTPSSWQDAGTSPLNPLNLLGINGFSASSMSNGHNHHNLNGHNHNLANLRSNLENQVPLINVSQFLQLHKPDLRTLHGYSELKIKLPLRESPFQEQSHGNISKRDEINNGEDDSNRDRLSSDSDSLHTSNTSFFHEVNMSSCTVFLPYINYFSGSDSAIESGAANRFEILISSSEGIISRYQLTLKSVNGNQIIPNSLRELNRWDLCYPLTTSNYVPSQGASNLNSNKFTSSTSWISAVGNRIDHIVDIPPVWMRPQCTLRRFRLDGEGKFSDRLPQNPISNTTTSTSHPISIESFAAAELRRSTPSHRSPILQDSSSTSEKGELSENQIFFFPERISTTLLKVDRHDFRDLTLNIGEKIHAAILTNLPEISDSESKHNIVITKHIDDITAWEMDDEWNGS